MTGKTFVIRNDDLPPSVILTHCEHVGGTGMWACWGQGMKEQIIFYSGKSIKISKTKKSRSTHMSENLAWEEGTVL